MQIEVKNIQKIFDSKTPLAFQAINNVSVIIKQGEMIAIIGPTGSGKTTFIEHLNGLLLPTKGKIIAKGQFYKKIKNSKGKKVVQLIEMEKVLLNTKKKIKFLKQLRKQIGVVFQFAEYQLFETTIRKEIMFGPVSMGVSKEKSSLLAKEYLKLVGLNERFLEISPFELSGGQKRRVALASILAMEPDFLVLDEPTVGLDPQGTMDMLKIFKKLNKNGKTVIIVTHNLDHVLQYTKKVLFFKNGRIIKIGKTLDILSDTKYLLQNDLEPPKLLHFANKLKAKGVKIGTIRSLEDLAKEIKNNINTKVGT